MSEDSKENSYVINSEDFSPMPPGFKTRPDRDIIYWMASKFQAGSIKGSIFELMVATIGSGVLVLPSAFAASGLTFSIIQLLTWAILGYYSTMLLTQCGKMANKYSYPELAQVTYGVGVQVLVKLIFFLNNWGGCVVYTILVTNCIGTALGIFYPNLPAYLTDPNSYFWPPIFTTIIILPLSLNRDLSALRYTSLMSFLIICFLSTVIVIESFKVDNFGDNFNKVHQFILPGVAVTFPNAIYSFSCHPNVLDVFHELQRASVRRMSKVLSRCMALACTVYIIVGTFGYITFADNTFELDCKGNILLSFQFKGYPLPIIITLILIGLSITLAMPLSIKPSKDSLRELLFGRYINSKREREVLLKETEYKKVEDSKLSHVCLVIFVVYSQMLCGMFITKMSSAITVLGASAYPMINYIFPCLYYLKLEKEGENIPKKAFVCFLLFMNSGLAIYSTVSFFITDTETC